VFVAYLDQNDFRFLGGDFLKVKKLDYLCARVYDYILIWKCGEKIGIILNIAIEL
jgi:hypothetical protein